MTSSYSGIHDERYSATKRVEEAGLDGITKVGSSFQDEHTPSIRLSTEKEGGQKFGLAMAGPNGLVLLAMTCRAIFSDFMWYGCGD